MKIAFRVDASQRIGTGHFMRCLTLADTLKQRGAQVRFVSRHMPEHLQDMLAAKGLEFILLNSIQREAVSNDLSHGHWLGTTQEADARDAIHALSDQAWDWLVVDHYALDIRWESVLRQTAKNILVIDDIADRRHDCDALLDQNFYVDMNGRYAGQVPRFCRLLFGPRYALLRDEFRQLHQRIKSRTGPVKRVLVFFGGADADNNTARAIDALANIRTDGLNVDVVIGAQHPQREQIETTCARYDFACHVQTDRMAELMAAADLAIGAGGSAIWERCCLGLPTLTICVADNQQKQIVDAASEGLLYAPELKDDLNFVIKRHVSALMENSCLRQVISRNGMRFVDGKGVSRVVAKLACSGMEIRVASEDDQQNLFEWRNHPGIRAVSRSANIISWENHQKWFASVLTDKDRVLLIGERDGLPVGVVRFDIQNDVAEVSIYLVPDRENSGQGRDLLLNAERWLAGNRPSVSAICANVLGGNEPSQRLFLGADYQVEATSFSKRLHLQ